MLCSHWEIIERIIMIIETIEKDFLNYRFPLKEGFRYGFNLYALIAGKNVMLFDSAFRSQIKEVKSDLGSRGLKITHVIATHFHNDHIAGLMALDEDVTVSGSPDFEKTLSKKLPQQVTPVSFNGSRTFGDFFLTFTPSPGHSACSIVTEINKKYLHIGDNLMSRYDGKAILPWVQYNFLERHIDSLKNIRNRGKSVILQSHGPAIIGEQNIKNAIDNRLSYLETVFNSDGNCTYQEAIKNCTCEFVGTEFFDFLISKQTL